MIDWDSADPELKAMRQEFIATLDQRRAALAPTLKELALAKKTLKIYEDLQLVAHKLAGAAESYGFPILTKVSAAVDDVLELGDPSVEQMGRFAQLLDEAMASASTGKDPTWISRDPRMIELTSVAESLLSEAKNESF